MEQRVFKNNGKRFEEDFRQSFKPHIWTYRPGDTGGGQLARFTQESLCDLIAFDTLTRNLILVELKSTLGTSFGVRPYEQCMEYEKEKEDFDNWNTGLSVEERKYNKEKIKEEKRRIKDLYKETNQAMIKYHQIKNLLEVYEKFDIETFIAFTFFKSVKTYVISVNSFVENFWKKTTKKSINEKDFEELVQVNQAYKISQEYIGRSMKSEYDVDIMTKDILS